jgi:hypothetical protein
MQPNHGDVGVAEAVNNVNDCFPNANTIAGHDFVYTGAASAAAATTRLFPDHSIDSKSHGERTEPDCQWSDPGRCLHVYSLSQHLFECLRHTLTSHIGQVNLHVRFGRQCAQSMCHCGRRRSRGASPNRRQRYTRTCVAAS